MLNEQPDNLTLLAFIFFNCLFNISARSEENMDEKLTSYCGLCCADCIPSRKEFFVLVNKVAGNAKPVVGAPSSIVSGVFIQIWITISISLKRWGPQIALKRGKSIIIGK